MSKPGRKTPKLPTLSPIEKRFPNPPPGLSKNARTVWHRITHAFEPDHFKPYQRDLLTLYCEAAALHRKAMLEIRKNGAVIKSPSGVSKVNPWVEISTKAASTMISLSTKLQLTVRSTLVNHGKQPKAPKPKTGREHLLFGGKDRKK